MQCRDDGHQGLESQKSRTVFSHSIDHLLSGNTIQITEANHQG